MVRSNRQIKAKLHFMFLALTAGSTLYAAADLKPTGLRYEDVPATTGGEFPHAAHQRVILTFKNVGDHGVGKTRAQVCPGLESDLICINPVNNLIKGNAVVYEDSAINKPRYFPGKTYSWELKLEAHTLKHCQATPVWFDVKNKLGQFGFGNPLANDKTTLTALRIGSVGICHNGVSSQDLKLDLADMEEAAEDLLE